jgi:hypothetical protein
MTSPGQPPQRQSADVALPGGSASLCRTKSRSSMPRRVTTNGPRPSEGALHRRSNGLPFKARRWPVSAARPRSGDGPSGSAGERVPGRCGRRRFWTTALPAGAGDFQIFVAGESGEDAPTLIYVAQPAMGDAEGRSADQFFSLEVHAPLKGCGEAHEDPQGRRFAGTVALPAGRRFHLRAPPGSPLARQGCAHRSYKHGSLRAFHAPSRCA